jgi:MATE family multidrug resistance protein
MDLVDVQAAVLSESRPYVRAMVWSVAPLLMYAAFRRYLQAIGRVRIVMFTLLSANLVNVAGNYILIREYGIAGVGWATCLSRVYMAGVLAGYTFLREPAVLSRIPRIQWGALRKLLGLGLPAAGQILLEVGVFAAATILAGKLRTESLAAHYIVLNIAGTTFMVPLGVSSAGAIAVGQALGRGDAAAARRAGWLAIAMGACFMFSMAIVMFTGPRLLLGIFTANAEVLTIAVPLLFVAAIFQVFDGLQVTITGVLRGAGDTKTPMYANLVAHWVLGLPAGYFLCFIKGLDVIGIWAGLSAGLILAGTALLLAWRRTSLVAAH